MGIAADREMLRGALLNLIDNAMRATVRADALALSVRLDAGGGIRFVVEDSGPGIPASERQAALKRFARPGARDAGGSGLGLAIVKAVALAHGGTIEVDQSPVLGGARVAIVLPPQRILEPGGG